MKTAALVIAAAVSLAAAPTATAQDPAPTTEGGPDVTSAAAILVDLESDDVLFARNVRARRAPASLTKVVTALVARERYDPSDVVTIGPRAAAIHGSRLGVEEGMTFTVQDLLYALLLDSGNDAAFALAEHSPGGYDYFIALMNEKARALGANGSRFANPHGLDQTGHHTTAWDLALFGRQLMADPLLARIAATPDYAVPWPTGGTRTIKHHHKMVGSDPRAIGVKTGFTNQAGHSLMSAASTSGRRLLSIVLGANDQYAETKSLFAFGSSHLATSASTTLGALPPPPEAEGILAPRQPSSVDPRDAGPFRWTAIMALLAAAMLATLHRAGRTHPLDEAAWYDSSLDVLPTRVRWTDGQTSRRPTTTPGRSKERAGSLGG